MLWHMISNYSFWFTLPFPALGDVMPSSLNLNRLLVLPSGCGEQNLVKTAVNWVVAEYLQATDQLQDFIGVKVKNNVQKGTYAWPPMVAVDWWLQRTSQYGFGKKERSFSDWRGIRIPVNRFLFLQGGEFLFQEVHEFLFLQGGELL